MTSSNGHPDDVSDKVNLSISSPKSVSKIPISRATYLNSLLRGTSARYSLIKGTNDADCGTDGHEAIPIPPSRGPPTPPAETPPASTEADLAKPLSSHLDRATRSDFNCSSSSPRRGHADKCSRENMLPQTIPKRDRTPISPSRTGLRSLRVSSVHDEEFTVPTVKHSTPKPCCRTVCSSGARVVSSDVFSSPTATPRVFPIGKTHSDLASLSCHHGKADVLNTHRSTRSTSGSESRNDDNELTWIADGIKPADIGCADSATGAARARRDHRRVGKDDHTGGVGVAGGDNRDRGEGGDASLCEDQRALYRGVAICDSRRYKVAERCAEADAAAANAGETASTGTLEGHNDRRTIAPPQLRRSASQPQKQTAATTMGAFNSKKPLGLQLPNHSGTKAVQEKQATANYGVPKIVKISDTREQPQQQQQQQQQLDEKTLQHQERKMIPKQKPTELSDHGEDDDDLPEEPTPLARKFKLKRDSIAVTKVRLSRTQQDRGATSIEEEEDAEESVEEAEGEQSTDRVHFNTSNRRDESDAALSPPNDSGLSLNSNYSTTAPSDPGSGRLVTVS